MSGRALKRNIVLRNEFSVPGVGGRVSGSRGASPSKYVLRYMARKGATEPIPPVRQVDHEAFIRRYMARADAVEALRDEQFPALERELEKVQGQGGVAFGYGSYSLSDEALRAASADVQKQFEAGRPVMKTVLSFDEDYLRLNHLVPEGFRLESAGDYRGNLDQLKLRLAIMRGLERMGRSMFGDLRYVGVIQVDTRHVHCHLAMVDAGEGGETRGYIGERAKSLLRRGVDSYLDETSQIAYLSSAVKYEQRNTTAFVKRWAFRKLREGSLTQSLVAALPQDRRMWRFKTNRIEMHRANALATEFVEAVLARPDSGFDEAMAQVREYADERRRREDLNWSQWRKLIDDGRGRIIERGVNSTYAVLRQLPDEALSVMTPLLDAANIEPVPDWDAAGLEGFVARLRIAGSRFTHHSREARRQRESGDRWQEAANVGDASPDSAAMARHYDIEREYHEACAAKYAGMLPLPALVDQQLEDRLIAAGAAHEKLVALETLRADTSLKRLSDPAEAERLGLSVYGEEGGWLLCEGSEASLAELDRRIRTRRASRRRALEELRRELADRGLDLVGPPEQPRAEAKPRRPELAAIDLHLADELWGRELPEAARQTFEAWVRLRRSALDDAEAYLRQSGQSEAVAELAVADQDVAAMAAAANGGTSSATHQPPPPVPQRIVRTVPAGARKPHEDMLAAVRKAAVEAVAETVGEGRGDPRRRAKREHRERA